MYQPKERPVGIWEWGFLYKETRGASSEADDDSFMSSSYPSPTHAGWQFLFSNPIKNILL